MGASYLMEAVRKFLIIQEHHVDLQAWKLKLPNFAVSLCRRLSLPLAASLSTCILCWMDLSHEIICASTAGQLLLRAFQCCLRTWMVYLTCLPSLKHHIATEHLVLFSGVGQKEILLKLHGLSVEPVQEQSWSYSMCKQFSYTVSRFVQWGVCWQHFRR